MLVRVLDRESGNGTRGGGFRVKVGRIHSRAGVGQDVSGWFLCKRWNKNDEGHGVRIEVHAPFWTILDASLSACNNSFVNSSDVILYSLVQYRGLDRYG